MSTQIYPYGRIALPGTIRVFLAHFQLNSVRVPKRRASGKNTTVLTVLRAIRYLWFLLRSHSPLVNATNMPVSDGAFRGRASEKPSALAVGSRPLSISIPRFLPPLHRP